MELTGSTGIMEEQYSYGPYGILSASGMTTTNTYAHTGREFDALGVDYFRARYYNPTTGRFLSEDPIGFAGSGTNLYAYAKNNPIKLKDPSGLCPDGSGLNGIMAGLALLDYFERIMQNML
jgi:RHS repeat-associated protein